MTGRHVSCTFTSTAQAPTDRPLPRAWSAPPYHPGSSAFRRSRISPLPAAGGSRSLTNLAAGTPYDSGDDSARLHHKLPACPAASPAAPASPSRSTPPAKPAPSPTPPTRHDQDRPASEITTPPAPRRGRSPATWEPSSSPRRAARRPLPTARRAATPLTNRTWTALGGRSICDSGERQAQRHRRSRAERNDHLHLPGPPTTPPGTLVYSSNRDGDYDIYLLDPTTRDGQPIPTDQLAWRRASPATVARTARSSFHQHARREPELPDGLRREFPHSSHQSPTIQRRPAISPDGTQSPTRATRRATTSLHHALASRARRCR